MLEGLGAVSLAFAFVSGGIYIAARRSLRKHIRPERIWFDRIFFVYSEETYAPGARRLVKICRGALLATIVLLVISAIAMKMSET
jgi:hypothetical protein